MNARPTIAGVIVTFHPDDEFEHRLGAIAREVDPLIVVDNTATPPARARLESACARHKARLVANRENLGLAVALKQAFESLIEQGVEWVVAFDQDSTPDAGFVAALRAAMVSAEPPPAVVGANWHDEGRPGFPSRHLRRHPRVPLGFERIAANRDLANVTCAITSGSLFNLPVWRELGGFDESLFLDLVDTEYCLRARAAGHGIIIAAGARLAHRRGEKRVVRRFGRTWWPAFMPPLRLRYLFRNRVAVVRRHGWRELHWVAFESVYAAKILAEIVFLEERKLAKLAACARGTWDGLVRAEGRLDNR